MAPRAVSRGGRGGDGRRAAPPLKSAPGRPQQSRHRRRSPLSPATVTAESGRRSRSRSPHRAGPSGSPGSCLRRPAQRQTRAAAEEAWEVRQKLQDFREYGESWYQSCKELESRYQPRDPLARQSQVTAKARCKLVCWISAVHRRMGLSFETLCLTVNILDRFLATTPVSADCFQLLGVTALLIACKQLEVRLPRVRELLALCCNAFTREQLVSLERIVLNRLGFELAAPTIGFFLDHFSRVRLEGPGGDAGEVADARSLAAGVAELSLADCAFTKYTPSLLAASCLGLADWLLGHRHPLNLWISGYPKEQLQACMDQLHLLVSLNVQTLPLLLPAEVAQKCPRLRRGL